MNIVYADPDSLKIPSIRKVSEIEPSIFLAGPIPRDQNIPSWRPLALNTLSRLNFDGHVFVPESSNGGMTLGYEEQIEWEEHNLGIAECIMFWIPRHLEYLPGFTTNIEFGAWRGSGKVVVGWLPGSPKMRYIEYYVRKLKIPTADTLNDTVKLAVKMATESAEELQEVARQEKGLFYK